MGTRNVIMLQLDTASLNSKEGPFQFWKLLCRLEVYPSQIQLFKFFIQVNKIIAVLELLLNILDADVAWQFVKYLRMYAINENNRLSLFISTILPCAISTILQMVTNWTIRKLVNSNKCNLIMIITICSLGRTANYY